MMVMVVAIAMVYDGGDIADVLTMGMIGLVIVILVVNTIVDSLSVLTITTNRVKTGDDDTLFVFNCQMGRGRTTTGMVVCCLITSMMPNINCHIPVPNTTLKPSPSPSPASSPAIAKASPSPSPARLLSPSSEEKRK